MEHTRWQQLEAIFHDLVDMPPDPARESSLQARCGGDAALVADVRALLAQAARPDDDEFQLVQLCAFLGCGRAEAAELLDISIATAKRDFRMARVWLSQRLQLDAVAAD